MKKVQELSGAELEVMQILWKNKSAMKVQDVCDALENDKWAYKTVATLLLRMEEKGAVVSEKMGKANAYTPILNKEEYTEAQTRSFVDRLYNGSAKDLAVSLFRSSDMTKEDIEEIKKIFGL